MLITEVQCSEREDISDHLIICRTCPSGATGSLVNPDVRVFPSKGLYYELANTPHVCLAYQVLLPSQPGDSKKNSNAWEQGLWAAKVGATTVGIGALFAITGINFAILQALSSSILSGMDIRERCCTSCCSKPMRCNDQILCS